MVPTLRPGQRVLCSPLRRPRRGDLVWVRRPDGSGLVKRLVGLPGEQVELVGARVRIDGRLLEEPYLEPRSDLQPLADAAWTLGPDAFVVLGDARDDSLDSRRFGPVKRAELAGRAALRLWPPAIL